MTNTTVNKPKVFLSSNFVIEIDGARTLFPLRQRICERAHRLPVELLAYEFIESRRSIAIIENADQIIDLCFKEIKECDLFVFLLSDRHGTGVLYSEHRFYASYLELELFAAAMLRKPVLVLHQRDRNPEGPLEDALVLLHREFSIDRYVIGDDNELYQRFLEECQRLATAGQAPPERILARLPEWLARWRTQTRYQAELISPELRFLDGSIRSHNAADPTKAIELLDQVASGRRGGKVGAQVMPHGVALFRIWAAMRELMDKDGRTLADPALALLWDRALGMWASHASWFGLHGHLWMGPLASVQSQIVLRRKFAGDAVFQSANDVREPTGARASALYSIAQRMYTWRQKVRQFRMAQALATQAIVQNPGESQGALSIRGHAAMQLARLGYVWKLWEAETDFREGLRLRERTGASAASIGEAEVDLGLCLASSGRARSGLELLQGGVARMRSGNSGNSRAFLARALRSLERGARFARRRDIADAANKERQQLAAEIEAMDQMRDA